MTKAMETQNVALTPAQSRRAAHGLEHRFVLMGMTGTTLVELFGNTVKEAALRIATTPGIHDALLASQDAIHQGVQSATDPRHLAVAAGKAVGVGVVMELMARSIGYLDADGAIARGAGKRHSVAMDTAKFAIRLPDRLVRYGVIMPASYGVRAIKHRSFRPRAAASKTKSKAEPTPA